MTTGNIQLDEENDFEVSTDAEWDRAEAGMMGAENSDLEWILSDRDVWYRNPHYVGEPGPHPDEAAHYEDGPEWEGTEAGIDDREDIPF